MPVNPGELVSVILPTYNRAHTLLRAVSSVLNQDYANLELIVVDDASTDATQALLSEIDDDRLRVVTLSANKGVSGATNAGVAVARGNLIAFQDSDDEWLYSKLTKQVEKFISADEKCVCIYCIKIVYGRDAGFTYGKRQVACVPGAREEKLDGDLRILLQNRNVISPQTVLCRRSALLQLGGFDEKLRANQDWDFFSRLSEIGTFDFVDLPLVNTYLQSDSISKDSRRAVSSQLLIMNKMKRRGVPIEAISERLAVLGNRLGRLGYPKRGDVLLKVSLRANPLSRYVLMRFIASKLRWLRRKKRNVSQAVRSKSY